MMIEFTTAQITTLAIEYANITRNAGHITKETAEMREISEMISVFGTAKNYAQFFAFVNIALAS